MSSRSILLQALVFVGSSWFAAGPASARTDQFVASRLTAAYHACHREAHGGTFPEAECIADENRRQDAVLNARWRRAIAGMPGQAAADLRRDERAWILRRDRRCRAEVVEQDVVNSTARLVYAACELNATVRRIAFLERLR